MAKSIAEKLILLMSGLLSISYGKELIVFIISLMPILELRGGLIAASLLGLDPIVSYMICIIGNIIPIPFILFLFNSIFKYFQRSKIKLFNKIALFLHKKIEKHKEKIEKIDFWGLVLFVGIPLPGTGAWTGCMIASVLEMDRKKAFLGTVLGVFMASIIMMLVSFGLLNNIIH